MCVQPHIQNPLQVDQTLQGTSASCAPLSVCNKVGSISSTYGNVKTSTSCCYTENCTASILAVPSVSSEPNGVTCPTCQSSSSSWCYEEKTVDCTGEEKVCALYSTDIDGNRSSIRGCANQNICSTQKYTVNGTNISYQSTCYCGGNSSNTYCPDTNVTCPSGTICARVQTLSTVGSASSEINRTACLPIYQCGISSSATFLGGTLRMMTICSTNNCNLSNPTWSSLNSTVNGVTCPACMSSNSEWCTAKTIMGCTGSETVCMVHTEKLLGTPSVMRGCTTRSNCYLGQLSHSAKGSEFDFKFICPTGGYNISCMECMDSTNCTGNSVTCPTGSVCATSYTESNIGGSVSNKTVIRSCAPLGQCGRIGSVSSPYGNIKMSSSCCAFDNCSSSILTVPSVSPQPNGVTCPTCQSSSSGWCYDEQTVECTGEENVCVLYSTNINGSLSSVRGCARRTCGSERYKVNGTGITYTSNCYCGGNASNTYCPDANVSCPHGTICARVYAVTTMDNTSVEVNNSACLPIYQCGISGSSTFLNGTQRLVTICSTNGCTLPDPTLTGPAPNSSYNGATCPTCTSKNAEWCTAEDTMQCNGSESICSVHSVKMTGASAVIRGCATRSLCSLGHLSHSAGSIFDFKFVCPNGGYNLSCSECTDSTTCTGSNVTCPSGSVCATSYTESTVGGSKSTRYIRSCAPASQCDKTGSVSTLNGNTKMTTSCCAFDNCSSSILPVPSVSSQPNGVTCPACQSSSSGWCYMEQTVQCTGNETVCVLYSTNINGSLSSIRGCTQQGTCSSQKYSVNGTAITYQTTCYCGGNSSDTYCPDTNVTCPSGTICARVHALSTMGNTSVEINNSTCLPIHQCGIPGSASSLNGTLRLVTICSTNTCNLPEPVLTGPSSSSGYNGVTCPTCMSENSEWCAAKDTTMQCTGSENVCLIYTSKLSGTPSVVRGCATRSNCYLSHLTHSMTGSGSNFDFKFICSSRGYALSCAECMDTTNCSGNNVTCPSGYVCATSYTESTMGDSKSTRYIRSCLPSSQCDRTGSISILDGNTKMSSSCCAFDSCSPSILPVPPVSPQPNGVTCPTCQLSTSAWCYNMQTVNCSGEETVCALYSTTIGGKASSVRGCARQSTCGSQKYSVNGTAISYQSTCYCGGNLSNTYCPDTNVTCPSGTICARVRAQTTAGNATIDISKSTCLPIYQCGMPGSASFLNGNLRLVTICSTDNCNLQDPALTGTTSNDNGVTCPTCTSKNSDWCEAKDSMQCKGSESICLLHTAQLPGTSYVFRGCATRSTCYLGRLLDSLSGSEFDFKFICSIGGYNLSCIECMNTTDSNCMGKSSTCSPGYVCATSYTESTVSGSKSTRYIRSCAPQNQCDIAGSASSFNDNIKTSTSCCAFDNCSSSILSVSSTGLQPNGVTCSACQNPSSSWCYNQQTMQCTGEENVCALYTTNIAGKVSAVRGCARQSICSNQEYSVNGMMVVYQPNCYCGGNASSTYCPGTNVSCPSGSICSTVHALTTMGDASYERYTDTCSPIYQCGIAGSATFLKGTMKLVTLCSTNNCNLPNAEFSADNSTQNGMKCQNCMAQDTDCLTTERVQCTGNEDSCFLQTSGLTETTSAKTAIRGCSTRNICELGAQTYNALGIASNVKYVCSSGRKHFPTSFFTMFVLCASTLKYLF
ncbi:G surface protein, allelic form 168-like [Rana temporaria]|uniref:G surface protein, allelic form 168-like n=1 Tax=Rana temporaria TaxID=8407 RepID=UPI001AACB3FE|nr:G surface protein, allelic form 168-like [Rana temporaria]